MTNDVMNEEVGVGRDLRSFVVLVVALCLPLGCYKFHVFDVSETRKE